jgi:hypothetical protein
VGSAFLYRLIAGRAEASPTSGILAVFVMSLARLTAALLISIVVVLPAAARASQSFTAGPRPPQAFSFRNSFGAPPEPVALTRDLPSSTLVPPVVVTVERDSRPAIDEAVPPSPVVPLPQALRAPPAEPLR